METLTHPITQPLGLIHHDVSIRAEHLRMDHLVGSDCISDVFQDIAQGAVLAGNQAWIGRHPCNGIEIDASGNRLHIGRVEKINHPKVLSNGMLFIGSWFSMSAYQPPTVTE